MIPKTYSRQAWADEICVVRFGFVSNKGFEVFGSVWKLYYVRRDAGG